MSWLLDRTEEERAWIVSVSPNSLVGALLRELVGRGTGEPGASGPLDADLTTVHPHGVESDRTKLEEALGERRDRLRSLERRLVVAADSGDEAAFRHGLSALRALPTTQVRETLRRVGATKRGRRALGRLPMETLLDLVGILEPAALALARDAFQDPAAFLGEGSPEAGRGLELYEIGPVVREATLSYLLVEADSVFQPEQWVRHVLRHVASRARLYYRELLPTIGAAGSSASARGLDQTIQGIIAHLERSEVPGASAVDRAREDESFLRSFASYELVAGAFLQGSRERAVARADLDEAVDQLARDHPFQLLKLIRVLGAEEDAWQDRAVRIHQGTLARLVTEVLALWDAGDEGGGLAAAGIAAAAEASAGPSHYLALVLQRIANGDLIDLEVIGAETARNAEDQDLESGSPETEPVSLEFESPAVGGESSASEPESVSPEPESWAAQRVFRELEGSLRPVGSATLGRRWLSALVQRAITLDPARVRRLLDARLSEQSVTDLLISSLPDSMLARMLRLLRTDDYRALHEAADLIAAVCRQALPDIAPGLIRRAQWRFTISYVVIEDRLFSEKHFVAGMVSFMAQELGWRREELARTLSQHLEGLTIPSNAHQSRLLLRHLSPSRGTEPTSTSRGNIEQSPIIRGLDPLPPSFDTPSERRSGHPRDSELELPDMGDVSYVWNAGLVLLAPFLPRLFAALGLVGDSGFVSPSTPGRAVHLTQYLVDGRTNAPSTSWS